MEEIIEGTEKMFGGKIDLNYEVGYPPVINNEVITKNVKDAAIDIVGNKNVSSRYLSMGGESNMGSNWGLIAFGLIALFATSFIKIAAIAAIAWGAWKTYQDWEAM